MQHPGSALSPDQGVAAQVMRPHDGAGFDHDQVVDIPPIDGALRRRLDGIDLCTRFPGGGG